MMTFTYILLWVLIGLNAMLAIVGRKQNKEMKEVQRLANRRQESADELQKSAEGLYTSAMEVLKDSPKLVAYDEILDAAENHHRAKSSGEVLTSDLDRAFYQEVDAILMKTQGEINK